MLFLIFKNIYPDFTVNLLSTVVDNVSEDTKHMSGMMIREIKVFYMNHGYACAFHGPVIIHNGHMIVND
jgi:hypothetical protein